MKKTSIKFFDKIIILLLGFFGVFSSCNKPEPVEYGPAPLPSLSDYEINGVVTDKANSQPIQNIRAIRRRHPDYGYMYGDTLYTDAEGKYDFNFEDFPQTEFHLKFEDIDGEENGGYFETQEIDITITEADRTGEKQFVKTQNVEMNKINEKP